MLEIEDELVESFTVTFRSVDFLIKTFTQAGDGVFLMSCEVGDVR